jgi:16S rRNA (uracil1498-N3)-methyltransferase
LQKATEIGVDKIYLWKTIYSNNLFSDIIKKNERFKKILKEASEQSNRIKIPELFYLKSIEEIKFVKSDLLLFFYEKANPITNNIKNYLYDLKKFKRIFIFIGPEGGFSKEEINLFELKKAKLVSLGENILRTETAAIVALALVKYFL